MIQETIVEAMIRELSQIICEKEIAESILSSDFCLNDKYTCYKYGYYFENQIFMIVPYCWCDDEQCNWCNEDLKPIKGAPGYNFWYKPTDFGVIWYKYIGRGHEYFQNRKSINIDKIPLSELQEMRAKCIGSLEEGS